jgi:Glycosyltransferase family 87
VHLAGPRALEAVGPGPSGGDPNAAGLDACGMEERPLQAAGAAEVWPFLYALRDVLLWTLGAFYLLLASGLWKVGFGHDAHAYWLAWRRHPMYGIAPDRVDAFLYSPVFAQAVWPLTRLSWHAFFALWVSASVAAFVWLLWPLRWRYRIPLLCLCAPVIVSGDIWPLLATVIVLGFRRPTLWSIALLTKVTAAMGLLWFAVRREWEPLLRALAAAAILVGVSAAVSPGLWAAWLHLLIHGGSATTASYGGIDIPFAGRLPVALGLATYGAAKGRVGFLIAAVAIGSPTFDFSLSLSNFCVFAALPRLRAAAPLRQGACITQS